MVLCTPGGMTHEITLYGARRYKSGEREVGSAEVRPSQARTEVHAPARSRRSSPDQVVCLAAGREEADRIAQAIELWEQRALTVTGATHETDPCDCDSSAGRFGT